MHLFKITLAFSSMAALTLADTGTVKWVSNEKGFGIITPSNGGGCVPMQLPGALVCYVYPKHISHS
jgi:hypothetical protein